MGDVGLRCRICGSSENSGTFDAREMMYGSHEEFLYFQCGRCGCLQIGEIPADISGYYPQDYCSFKPSLEKKFSNSFRNLFRLSRYRYAVLRTGLIGRILHAMASKADLDKLADVGLKEDSRVLDVGCGSGSLLYVLRSIGMKNLLGVDAFIERDVEYANGVRILRNSVADVDGVWDCVMFCYSLEHMPDQHSALRSAARLLADGGTCYVRIPLSTSYAWEHYGVNWVQLDAPRHFYLHSIDSFELVAREAGLAIRKVVYDSTVFQLWASELYERGLPLYSGLLRTPSDAVVSSREMNQLRRRVSQLNRDERGDQATFYLEKK